MAYSFCCAPLQRGPPFCATATRCLEGSFGLKGACFPGSLNDESRTRFPPPIALGGYRPRGCQVREMPVKWGQIRGAGYQAEAAEIIPQPSCRPAQIVDAASANQFAFLLVRFNPPPISGDSWAIAAHV